MTTYDKQTLVASLQNTIPLERILIDEPMKNHTTFKIGGPADVMVLPSTIEEIQAAIATAKSLNAPWCVMGLGSNILCADEGLRGLVIKLAECFAAVTVNENVLVCQAGVSNEEVANIALQNSLTGYEFASGIPGSIGGAAFMNAGAYDGEFKDVAIGIKAITLDGEIVNLSANDAQWSYRHSKMMDDGLIIIEATLQLKPGNPEDIEAKMADLKFRREDKQPLEMPSAGSTFKRPEGYFVGKLLQDAGLRGYTVGGAQVSEKHCGFVVNANNATAKDVLQLISNVQNIILERNEVKLEPEVRMWGFEN